MQKEGCSGTYVRACDVRLLCGERRVLLAGRDWRSETSPWKTDCLPNAAACVHVLYDCSGETENCAHGVARPNAVCTYVRTSCFCVNGCSAEFLQKELEGEECNRTGGCVSKALDGTVINRS